MNYLFPNPSLKCTEESRKFVKDNIYKHKINIFGLSDDDYTRQAKEIFEKTYQATPNMVYIDKLYGLNFQTEVKECLFHIAGSNPISPKIYLNYQYLGNLQNLENMIYRRDLDIFF